jgi:hypothetical protein
MASTKAALKAITTQHRGRKARANAVALEAKVLEWTRRGPDDGTLTGAAVVWHANSASGT